MGQDQTLMYDPQSAACREATAASGSFLATSLSWIPKVLPLGWGEKGVSDGFPEVDVEKAVDRSE